MMRQIPLLTAAIALSLALAPEVRAATFIVTSTADGVDTAPGDGVCTTAAATCTLRAAIQEANTLSGADSITLPAGTYALSLFGAGEDAAATGDLDITGDLTITGAVTGQTIVNAAGIDRVFDIFAPAAVTLSRLTIQNGKASGVDVPGGGIRNAGTVTLALVAIRANIADGDGGGLANRTGGSVHLTNVTVTGNGTTTRGGGIANDVGGTLQLTNVTVSGNSAAQGGGVDNIGSVQAVNTIIANSLTGGTCAGAVLTSLGHNLDSGSTCLFTEPGDVQNKDPKLQTLLDTGSTFVLPLQANSPAIDAGDNLNCPPTDQRGQLRPADGNNDGKYLCDIGAYEFAGPVLATPTASPTGTATNMPPPATGTNTPTATRTPSGGAISLSKIVGHPGEQIVFSATLSTKGTSIARTQNDIAFDSSNAPIAVGPNAAPDCTVNPQLLKEATVFAFQPDGCSGVTCTSIRATVLSATNTTPIADGSLLYTCKASIAPNAAAGEYPLTISAVVLQSPSGAPLPNPGGSSGVIVVVIPTPSPTPGAADCCQCSGPAVCGPATTGCGACVVVFGAACDGSSGQCMPFTVTPTRSVTATTSETPTATRTGTPTDTPPSTPTHTPVPTGSATAIATPTPSVSSLPTTTNTASASQTITPSPATPTVTSLETATATLAPTGVVTHTGTATVTATPTVVVSQTETSTPTAVASQTGTVPSATVTSSPISTPSSTETVTATEVPTRTSTATATASRTPTATTSATGTEPPTPTPSASPTPKVCAGDCDHSGDVTVTDIVTMVNIALESAPVTACTAGDVNGDGQVTVDEILTAVGNNLSGCPAT